MEIQIEKNTKEPWDDRHKIVSALINKNGAEIAVELGVAFGGNSENILSNTNVKKLYGVDSYKNRWTYNDGMNKKQPELDYIYQKTIERLKKFGQRYEHIRKSSRDALKDTPNNLDFVYIDADHSYIGCLNDLRLWVPKVKVGGIIAGDDYHSKTSPGVTIAVNKYFKKLKWGGCAEGPHVWWVKKEKINPNLSFFNKLFLFNPIIRKIHFFLGEFYNATFGKFFFKTYFFRKRFKHKFREVIKKILPNKLLVCLKKYHAKDTK